MPAPTEGLRCREAREQLSALLDGELSPARQALLLAHLEACPACMAEYSQLQAAWEALEQLPAPEAGRHFARAVLERVEEQPWPGRLRALLPASARFVPASAALALTLLVGLVAGGFLGSAALPVPTARPAVQAEVSAASTLSALDAFTAAPQGSLAQGYMQLAGMEGK